MPEKKKLEKLSLFRRAYPIVYTTLIVSTAFIAGLNFYYKIYLSAYASLFAILGYGISMYFMLVREKPIYAAYAVYFTLAPAATFASYFEGLLSGNIWFVFVMLYAVPFMIRREKYYKKQTRILYVVTITCVLITFILSPLFSEYYNDLSLEYTLIKLLISSTVSFIVIMIFSSLAVNAAETYLASVFKEKERAEKEKDSRTRVLANLGHELRTQINSINGISQLILEKEKTSKSENNYAETLEYCNSNMLVLVNDMLDMHKIESGGFELFYEPKSLGKLLSKATIPFVNKAEEKHLLLESFVDVALESKTVNIDETRLMQVIHNLLTNAIKFTSQGGVVFSAKLISETEDKLDVKFAVKDTGIGVSKENFDKIFDSFQQIKSDANPIYGGTGLGLAISKTIIEKMGSQIEIDSTINKGTTFHFTISFDKLQVVPINYNKLDVFDENYLSQKSILVVEDNTISMMFAAKLLKDHGATVYKADNGIKAIEQVKAHDDLDIVLLDLEMPIMNGFKAIEFIKGHKPNLTVIAFTANIPSKEMIEDLIELGFDDIISKPFKKDDMFKVLQKHINNKITDIEFV